MHSVFETGLYIKLKNTYSALRHSLLTASNMPVIMRQSAAAAGCTQSDIIFS